MRKLTEVISFAIIVIASQASAQMMKPAFGPELAKLSFLTGNFTTQTRVTIDPGSSGGTTGSGTIRAHWGLDSMFVFLSSQENNPALGIYKGFGVLGYDSPNDQYTLTMFNNFADHPEYTGHFVGDTLMLFSKVASPQGSFDQQLKWFRDGNNVRLQIFNDFGQGYSLMIDQAATPSADSTKGTQGK